MRITKRLKVGSYINCESRAEVKKNLARLSEAGYGAVRAGTYLIAITSVPEVKGDKDGKEGATE